MGILDLFKDKPKENLLITVTILTKKKYNYGWTKENIGDLLARFCVDYFDGCSFIPFAKESFFTGFEMGLWGSKFELNKIKDINNSEQFILRYNKFLPRFMEFMTLVLRKLKLKYKICTQQFESSLEEYELIRANNVSNFKEII